MHIINMMKKMEKRPRGTGAYTLRELENFHLKMVKMKKKPWYLLRAKPMKYELCKAILGNR